MSSVGQGVHEYKMSFGPGYRMYFGKDGEELIILLAGGTKKNSQKGSS
jgi:putative addiction module killer protein